MRQKRTDGHYIYYETIKWNVTGMKRVEIEQRLSEEEYLQLLVSADAIKHQIRKERYCFTYENQYFEIDIYPFWKDQAILEIELNDDNEQIRFPEELEIIREVTDDKAYKNAALAELSIAEEEGIVL